MILDPKNTAEIARQYFGSPTPLRQLGAGVGGHVYLSPDLRTAVKIHNGTVGFNRELDVYRRLKALGITGLHGLTIPKLRAERSKLLLIQMDFVSPPYLLDFAGVLFEPPEKLFDQERLDHWHQQIAERFGPNAHIVYAVYRDLAKHDLYYVDFRPSNLNLTGLPGLEPDITDDDQDAE